MDIPDVHLLDEILADMGKQNGPTKQSINPPFTNGLNGDYSVPKTVRFTQPQPSPPVPPIIKEQSRSPVPPPPPPSARSPVPTPSQNGNHNGYANGGSQQPLHVYTDTLHVPGDRSFLHSPSAEIVTGNGVPTPAMKAPSPRADYGLNQPTVLEKTITGGWVASEKHADACGACPVFSANDNSDDARFQSYHLDYKYTPPPIKGPCCVCNSGIIGTMVTALDKMWHPEHFCCYNCHKELRPPYFVEHAGEPYCKGCHNMLFLPPCAGCNREIQGNFIQPMGKVWHPDCFRCANCTRVLSPDDFFQRDGQPYCTDCKHNLFCPKCHGCKNPIKDERKVTALGGLHWHPTCFKCCKCSNVLNSGNYKERDNRLFCEKCYNDAFMPKCAGCHSPILQQPTSAMGKQWHPQCFKCCDCRKALNPSNFRENGGKPFCDDCFHNKFSQKCAGCNTPIKDQQPMNALGKPWHPQCFKCSDCKKTLNPSQCKENGGRPFCEDCYHNKFSQKCAGCRQPIKDPKSMVMAQGKPWHPEHFTCTECRKQLDPKKFLEKDGLPYCEEDYHRLFSPKCGGCHQPIKNPKNMVSAQGKKWHPEHFNCTECHKQLDPNKFFEKDGRPYCEDDYHRLFSNKCGGCHQPIKTKAIIALGEHWHPEHFCCTVCGKQLEENKFYEGKDGKPYCIDDFLRKFAPHCKKCKKPITDSYCLSALGGDWHADCFRCMDCNCLLEEINFFEINGEPYCEQHFHARQCPDCVRIRRAQNQYFGLSPDTPMQVRKWASTVSLKSVEINNTNGQQQRSTSQMSQYSAYSSSSELGRCATPLQPLTNGHSLSNGNSLQRQGSSSYLIPIERECASSSLSNHSTKNDNLHHIHDQNGTCLHDMLQRSSSQQSTSSTASASSTIQNQRANALGGKSTWKKSQDNLQYIAKNQSPYVYNEPGKFPVLDTSNEETNKHIKFEEVMTKREYEAVKKHY